MREKLRNLFPSRCGVVGINSRNLDLLYTHNPRRNFPNVDDKLRCKTMLSSAGIPTPETLHVVTGPATLRQWSSRLGGYDDFVIKPTNGFGGNGIMVVKRSGDRYAASGEVMSVEDIDFHLKQILNGSYSLDNTSDSAFFERKVTNHEGIQAFIPEGISGVADIRIIYQLDQPVMAMLRLPTKESDGKANLHQGGIGVGIDVETGLTLHGCYRNSIIERHQETDEPLAGRTVPFFHDMVAAGSAISDIVGLGYIGVDFVCDKTFGPLVLEVNARPGLNIQIANQAGLRNRLR